jgi:hypothetical protein
MSDLSLARVTKLTSPRSFSLKGFPGLNYTPELQAQIIQLLGFPLGLYSRLRSSPNVTADNVIGNSE